MSKLKVLDLFSGIGGFSLGLERTGGFETVAFCEIEKFPQKVLKKHWPEVPIYEDVRELTEAKLTSDGITGIDVITGGFPCQDISVAGPQNGMGEGTRSGLWSEISRLVGEIRPSYIIVENVPNLLSGPAHKPGAWFSRVLSDLAGWGYDAEWRNIPAASVGAKSLRERAWIVAYPQCVGRQRRELFRVVSEETITELGRQALSSSEKALDGLCVDFWPADAARIYRSFNVVPDRLDRIRAVGNAVVPKIPELIGRSILWAQQSEKAAA